MRFRTSVTRRERIRRIAVAGLVVAGLATTTAPVQSQDIGKALRDAVTDAANAATPATQAIPAQGKAAAAQSAVDRGVNRAVQDALQGKSPRDAIRTGLGEAARSSVETPAQTLNRDQAQQLQNQQMRVDNVAGQPVQRDAQGRSYYLNSTGQAVYIGPNGYSGPNQTQQGHYYGAQFQPNERGVGIRSVQQESFAGRAGLNQGDVILSVNGRPVNDQTGLVQAMNQIQPNQSVKMTVLRDGKVQVITTTTSQTYGQDQRAKGNLDSVSINEQLQEMRKQIKKLQSEVESLKIQIGQTSRN